MHIFKDDVVYHYTAAAAVFAPERAIESFTAMLQQLNRPAAARPLIRARPQVMR